MKLKPKLKLIAIAVVTALASIHMPTWAETCTLLVKDGSCTFATDSSAGQVIFTNPTNLNNIGSGVINPFLGLQANGSQTGVSTDSPIVNTLPLNDKRDNTNTFTNTFTRNDLQVFTIGGKSFYQFLLDTNEPNGPNDFLLSIDTLRIWDAQSALAQLLTNVNVTSLADVDGLFSSLIYTMGPTNNISMDGTLFAGSGKGYDLSVFVPVDLFAGVAMDSRLIFGTGMSGTGDGFEEWAYAGRTVPAIPEPETYALMLAGLGMVGFMQRRRKSKTTSAA